MFRCCNLELDHSLGTRFSCQNTYVSVAAGDATWYSRQQVLYRTVVKAICLHLEQCLGARWDTVRHIWHLCVDDESHLGYLNSLISFKKSVAQLMQKEHIKI